ncbi:Ankyrin repeat-containing protein [Spironucleus salmonicida]|uniref:Ankyrin repeat-containing protein n=1 Tax=Spironucleus salmonicida TaxID=348837 RepID=V6LMA6_9EUKA|nr:Ankyrin repeat-containing protein [Spironucleus salmonicida]|eukprot:EST41849.1 Ankyrin repeat-containing protein [Spironucleus salmonicida]
MKYMNPLQQACLQHNLPNLKASIHLLNHSNPTPLMLAAQSNFVEALNFLSENAFETLKCDTIWVPKGALAIQFAATYASKSALSVLISEQKPAKMTDLMIEVVLWSGKINKYIIQYQQYIMSKNLVKAQNTFKTTSSVLVNKDQVRQFIARDGVGRTYLHYLALQQISNFDAKIVEKLIEIAVELRISHLQDNLTFTALHYASISGNVEFVQTLLSLAPENAKILTKNGYSALMLACQNNKLSVVKKLVCETQLVSNEGLSGIFYAAINKNHEICDFLDQFEDGMKSQNQSEVEICGNKILPRSNWQDVFTGCQVTQQVEQKIEIYTNKAQNQDLTELNQVQLQMIQQEAIYEPVIEDSLYIQQTQDIQLDTQALSNLSKDQDVYESLSNSQKSYKMPYPFAEQVEDIIYIKNTCRGKECLQKQTKTQIQKLQTDNLEQSDINEKILEEKLKEQEIQYLSKLENVIDHYELKMSKMRDMLTEKLDDQSELANVLKSIMQDE